MNHFAYPATLVPDIEDGGFVVTFVDLPEAITQGDDLADALHQAADCLEESIAGRISDNELIPQPSPVSQAHYLVHLPAQTAVKATLYNAMRQSAMSQSELAKRLNSLTKRKITMNNANTETMVPTQYVFQLRLYPFVEEIISESKDNVYLNKHSQEEWQTHTLTELMEYMSFEQFMAFTDDELKELVGKQMALELVAGMLNDFTPEQMATFDECLVRR